MMIEVFERIKKEMEKNKIGFNDLVKYLGISPTQVSKLIYE